MPLESGLPGSGVDCELREDETEPFGVSLLFFCVIHLVTCLWRRLIVPYQMYPWCLVRMLDPRLDKEEQESVASKFLRAPLCCLDVGFSDRLRSQSKTMDSLLEGGRLHPIIGILSHHKVVNSEIENNFARASSAAKCARGPSPYVSPILCMFS